jgi:polyisoprenoid-binding protein YceI
MNFRHSLALVTILAIGVVFAGCNKKNQPPATPESAAEEVSQLAPTQLDLAAVEGNHYLVDPTASIVQWFAQKAVVDTKHHGTVQIAEGEIVLNQDNSALEGAKFVLDMTTINDEDLTGQMKEMLETHLRSEDFFSVEAHPTATLLVTSVEENQDGQYLLNGELTIKDITHPVTFPATIALTGDVITANAELTIDRAKWDVQFGSDTFFDDLGDNLIENEIRFEIELVARLAAN